MATTLEAGGTKKRALVVEDNADARSALQEAFGLLGFEVDVAEVAAEGMAIADRQPPDVVVMDGGRGAFKTITGLKEKYPRCTVVLFTGWAHLEAEARAAGADACVLKPDFDGLMSAVSVRVN